MGQVISFILRHLLGGTRTAENIKPVLNEDYSPVLPSYHMDFIEEHNHKSSAATATFHQLYQLAEHDLCQPRIATNSIVPSTVGSVEETKELIAKAAKEATTSTNDKSKKRGKKKSPENEEVISFHRHDCDVTILPQKQQQQQVVSGQLAEDDLCQPRITTNSIVASTVGSVEETKELIAKAAKEATTSTNSKRKKRRRREKKSPKSEEVISFHRYDRDVTIPPQKQQRQQVVSGQLAEDDLCQPRIATNSTVASIVGSVEETKELIAKATKEATASMNSKKKRRRRKEKKKSPKSEEIISFHRHNRGVTILPQKQPREQVMSGQLVEDNLRQPSIATNSIIAIPVGSVQETKELIAKAAKKATTSTNSKKKRRRRGEKRSLKSKEVISFHRHDRDVTIPPQKQQRQQVVSSKLAEHNLRQPRIATNSVISRTVGSVEETKELIAKATKGATTSTNSKKKRRRGKKKSPNNEEVISFHRHDRGVTIPPQKQQQQEVVSGQLAEDNLHQPLVETSSIVASTVGSVEETKELIAKATKEATTSTNSKRKRRRRGKKKSPENEEVISFHRYDRGVTIPPQKQQRQQVVSGQLSKDNLHQPLVQTNSIVASTISSVEETIELIAKATKESTASTNSKRERRRRGKKKSPENEEVISFHRHDRGVTIPPQKQQRQQVVSSQLAEDNVRQPLVETNFIVASTVGCVEETKELIAKAAKEATASMNNKKKRRRRRKKKSPENEEVISFHQHDCGVTIPPQKQQRQQVASGQLVEYNLHQPLVQTNSIVASTISSVEETKELIAKAAKEATTSTNSKRKRSRRGKKKSLENEEVISFHRYDSGVTIPPQKQQRQQVVSGQLAEDNVRQPLVETNFFVASTVGSVEETKELIAKAAKEATASTNNKKKMRWRGKKKSPENEEVISFHQHDCGVAIPPQKQRQQVLSSQLAEDNLSQPLVETNSIVASTISSVEETKELIAKAANEATTSTNNKKKRRRRGKKKSIEHEEVISFHGHDRGVTIPPQKQQQQLVVSGQLAEDNVRQPLMETNFIVASTVGSVEETKELIAKAAKEETASTNSKMKRRRRGKKKSPKNEEVISFHPHDCGVAILPQKQRQQVMSSQLAEDNLSQPLVETNSIVASTAGSVEKTKELITTVVKEEANSRERKRNKNMKSTENDEAIRKIGPYVHSHKILLVGEGDFSFSASLVVAFGHASNIVATSLNNKEYLQKNYKDVMANIKELESRGALVFHGVDATKMADHDQLLAGMTFDRIIFNFPHTGYFANTTSDLSRNQMLVVGFLRNAKQMIEEHGEIHVTHKTSPAFIKWKIVELASAENLYLIKEAPFDPKVYQGYHTKFGFRGNKDFNCYPCSSYKFGISCGGLSA